MKGVIMPKKPPKKDTIKSALDKLKGRKGFLREEFGKKKPRKKS